MAVGLRPSAVALAGTWRQALQLFCFVQWRLAQMARIRNAFAEDDEWTEQDRADERLAQRLDELNPSLQAHFAIGMYCLMAERHQEAIDCAERALRAAPKNQSIRENLERYRKAAESAAAQQLRTTAP